MTREEAIDVFKHNYPSACFTDLCEAVEIAIQALSAQLEIVRCKNCKHNQLPSTSPNASCEIFYGMTDQNGFCHKSERRTDV